MAGTNPRNHCFKGRFINLCYFEESISEASSLCPTGTDMSSTFHKTPSQGIFVPFMGWSGTNGRPKWEAHRSHIPFVHSAINPSRLYAKVVNSQKPDSQRIRSSSTRSNPAAVYTPDTETGMIYELEIRISPLLLVIDKGGNSFVSSLT